MNAENIRHVEKQIGYVFQNKMLLQQAFIRRSYSEEHPDSENNEVLEFIGDKVLDVTIVKELDAYFGRINQNREYSSKKSEGKLTALKQKLVEGKMLASRIEMFGLQNFLIMGKGDIQNHVEEDVHVKEDLFEAILGAAAVDSGWNFAKLEGVVDCLLDPDYYIENGFGNDENYVALIQQWCQKEHEELPEYDLSQWYGNLFRCTLTLPCIQRRFDGDGESKSKARMSAAQNAYAYLTQNRLLRTTVDEIGVPEPERAINQLQELFQKGYIGEPRYGYFEERDQNGNPTWRCECRISGTDRFYCGIYSSKKQGKKQVAYEMLRDVLGWKEDE